MWEGQVVGTPRGPTSAQFANTWSLLAKKYAGEKRIMFGLMNEPHVSQSLPVLCLPSHADSVTLICRRISTSTTSSCLCRRRSMLSEAQARGRSTSSFLAVTGHRLAASSRKTRLRSRQSPTQLAARISSSTTCTSVSFLACAVGYFDADSQIPQT